MPQKSALRFDGSSSTIAGVNLTVKKISLQVININSYLEGKKQLVISTTDTLLL